MMQDFRREGAPADIGIYEFGASVLVFQYTFSGVTYSAAIRSGARGWAPLSVGTDPLIVLQAAFNAMVSGDSIEITRGTYTINGALAIDGKNLLIILDDGATIYLANGTDTNMLNLSNVTKFTINGSGIFDGNKVNQTDVNIRAISCTNVLNLIIEGPYFKNHMNGIYATPIDVSITGRTKIIDCTFTGCEGTIYYADAINCVFDDCLVGVYYGSIISCTMHRMRHGGAYLNSGTGAVNNHIRPAAGAAISAINIEYGGLANIRIIGNEIDLTGGMAGGTIGISVSPNQDNQTAENIVLDGNTINGATQSAIVIKEHGKVGVIIRKITIDNNILSNSTKYGVEIDYPPQGAIPSDIVIGVGNQFINNTLGAVYDHGTNTKFLYDKNKEFRLTTGGGFTTVLVNGYVTFRPFYLICGTTVAASSKALAQGIAFGLNDGSINQNYVDWTKRLELLFVVSVLGNDAERICRVQLKATSAEGILANVGIGIQMTNYAMVGEAYGSARQTVALATLTDSREYRIRIVVWAGAVDFYVNGVYTASLTGTAVPNAVGVASSYLVLSIINGATGGVDDNMYVGNIQILQER